MRDRFLYGLLLSLLALLFLSACTLNPTPVVIIVTPTPPPAAPTQPPTVEPTAAIVVPTAAPTQAQPTAAPTQAQPTAEPTQAQPTAAPTEVPASSLATSAPTSESTVPTITPPPGTPIVCSQVPIRGFGNVWAQNPQVQQGLGCPYNYYYCQSGFCSGEQAMVSAVQRFEHGTMLWVNRPTWEGEQWVYVLFDDGTYQRFLDTWREGDPESDPSITPPEGLYQPIRGFGKVWREGTGAQVRERLGWATEQEQGGDGAWQAFDRGTMFWIGPVDRIYVIYEYDTNYNQVHRYEEFVDTF